MLQEFFQSFDAQVSVSKDVFEDLRVKYFCRVKRDGRSFAVSVLEDHVTTALTRERKANVLQNGNDLTGGNARQLRH